MNPVATQWLAVTSPPLAFVVTLSLLSWLLGPGRRWMPIDRPNERSLHTTPTPRSGGVAVIGASLLAALAITPAWPLAGWLAAGAGVLAGVSLIDDFRDLPALLRLVARRELRREEAMALLPQRMDFVRSRLVQARLASHSAPAPLDGQPSHSKESV